MGRIDEPLSSSQGVLRPTISWSFLPTFLAILSCVLYSLNGELLQALQNVKDTEGHASPLLNLALCHLGGLAFLPWLLYRGGVVVGSIPVRWPSTGSIAASSLVFAFLLMSYNYAWLMSAKHLTAGLTNAFFQTSVAMTFVASVALFREPLSVTSLAGVGLALFGPVLASGFLFAAATDSDAASATVSDTAKAVGAVGAALAVLAALGYTAYQVLFRHIYSHLKNDVRFLMFFMACVSGWHLVVILPLVSLAGAVGFEPVTIPHGTLAVLGTLASAIIASTVNGLYLCIVMWGSPMLLPCASALSVPSMVMLDIMFHHVIPTRMEVLGHLLVVLSVVLILSPQIGRRTNNSLKENGSVFNRRTDNSLKENGSVNDRIIGKDVLDF